MHDVSYGQYFQSEFRSCKKCQVLFYGPFGGVCAAGGAHDLTGSWDYGMWHDFPSQLDFDFKPIAFSSQTAAGGYAHLTLQQNGNFIFSGHMHDSGAIEYSLSVVAVVTDIASTAYSFGIDGHVAGTFESGSRNWDWNTTSFNQAIADNWANIAPGPGVHWKADATADWPGLVTALISGLGLGLAVIACFPSGKSTTPTAPS